MGAALALNQGPPCPAEVHTHPAREKPMVEMWSRGIQQKGWDHYLKPKVEELKRDETR